MDEREKALTLREALRVLGIGSNPGSALVRHGVLPAQVTPSVTLIWQGDLDRFRSRYMLFKEISALVERPSAPATKIVLDGLGIRPAKVAPELDVSIYERRVVEEAVAAWKADPTLLKPVQRRITAKLPACDVRDRLGCNDSLVKRMIAEGLLEASVGPREVEVREPALDEYPASDASHVADDVDAERREQGTGCLGASCCVVVARHHRRRHGRPRAVEGHQRVVEQAHGIAGWVLAVIDVPGDDRHVDLPLGRDPDDARQDRAVLAVAGVSPQDLSDVPIARV